MCKAQEYVDTLIDILQDIKQTFEFNEKSIEDLNLSTVDLDHEIEISTFDACRGYKLAKEFQRVRRERRVLSDENTILKYLYNFWGQYPDAIKNLQQIQKDIKREQSFMKTRKYTPKIRTDLTIPTLDNVSKFNKKAASGI